MLVAIKLSVCLAAEEREEGAQSVHSVPSLCPSCNWDGLFLPDKTKACHWMNKAMEDSKI